MATMKRSSDIDPAAARGGAGEVTAKRANRVAWGVVAVLAMVLLGGVGTMLYRGVSFPGGYVGVVASGGIGAIVRRDVDSWIVTRYYSRSSAVLIVSRTYSQQDLPPDIAKVIGSRPPSRPPRTATPVAPPASAGASLERWR